MASVRSRPTHVAGLNVSSFRPWLHQRLALSTAVPSSHGCARTAPVCMVPTSGLQVHGGGRRGKGERPPEQAAAGPELRIGLALTVAKKGCWEREIPSGDRKWA